MKHYHIIFRTLSFLLAFWVTFPICLGQEMKDEITPLKIGDTVPDIVFQKMINYKDSAAKLSDFKGKSILLDFWATWCVPCIASFPKLEKMQREYSKDLQIILASSDVESKLHDFYSKKSDLILPTAFYKSKTDILSKLFPHREIPHYVWIDKEMKVYAITEASYINENNIERFLKGEHNNMRIKEDFVETEYEGRIIDSIETLPGGGNSISINPNIMYQSMITRYDPRITKLISQTRENFRNRFIEITNSSVAHMVEIAHRIGKDTWKIYYDLSDTTLDYPSLANGQYHEWVEQNSYSYRLILEKPNSLLRYKIMQRDLEMAFGVKGTYKEMEVPCLLLRKSGNISHLQVNAADSSYVKSSIYYFTVQNKPVSELINIFYKYHLGAEVKLQNQRRLPIIDETGINGNISIYVNHLKNIRDLDILNKALKKEGLELIPSTRKLELLVITDK